jgi:hypothetical protein
VAAAASPERRGQMVSLASSAGILGWAASPLTSGSFIHISPMLLIGMDMALFAMVAVMMIAAQRGLFDQLATNIQGRGMPAFPHVGLGALRPSFAAPRGLLNRLHVSTTLTSARKPQLARFTTAEVVDALSGRTTGPRADTALDMAAQTVRWLPAEPQQAFREVGRYADRVPSILYQVRNGGDFERIGRELSPLGGSWPVRRTVEIAADLIARELNR